MENPTEKHSRRGRKPGKTPPSATKQAWLPLETIAAIEALGNGNFSQGVKALYEQHQRRSNVPQ